ncbi:MAG: cytochrome c class [Alphaproteobacteria bacterium]|nr:cytochrome c class [Alphaproteobacteria bacterium]
MKKFAAALVSLAFLQTATAFAQAPDAAAGKALWDSNNTFCKNCHGKAGEGAFGPDLAGRGLSAAQFQHAVRTPWGAMPTFVDTQVSDAELAQMAAWLGALPKVAEPGPWRVPVAADAPHGQQVYMSAGCAQCHGATFDQPRAMFGGRNGDFALMKALVYTHTTTMPQVEPQRPGSRLRMGNFNPLRLSEGQLKEIFDWSHDEIGFRPALQAQFAATEGGSYALNVTNTGEAGKGLTAQKVTIDLVIPAGVTVTAATGDGYKGVHTDDQAKANVAEWQVARLAPKDTKAFTVILSQPPANPADLKGTIKWAKPAPKTGPSQDTVTFAVRPTGPGG